MNILGIESSCDETGIAIYNATQGLLCNQIYSQIPLHQQYGGVIPELAARDHLSRLIPLLQEACENAKLKLDDISAIAYTAGPGLVGALMVGAIFARSLAFALNIPAIPIHHLEGHLLAPLLEEDKPHFPFLALLVSGGHTQLIHVEMLGKYHILGETIDDAAGEAFDKTAKLLGLPYPGGAELSKLATHGHANVFHFPRPMLDKPNLNFSFSGLKTAALHTIKNQAFLDFQTKANIAKAFESAVVETLVIKSKRALEKTNLTRLVIAGGVSANLPLRKAMQIMAEEQKAQLFYPRFSLCTDNGAMIAFAGFLRLQAGQTSNSLSVNVRARWPMEELNLS